MEGRHYHKTGARTMAAPSRFEAMRVAADRDIGRNRPTCRSDNRDRLSQSRSVGRCAHSSGTTNWQTRYLAKEWPRQSAYWRRAPALARPAPDVCRFCSVRPMCETIGPLLTRSCRCQRPGHGGVHDIGARVTGRHGPRSRSIRNHHLGRTRCCAPRQNNLCSPSATGSGSCMSNHRTTHALILASRRHL